MRTTSYMADVDKVTSDSEQIGKQLNTLIATPGLKLQDLQDRLDGLRNQQAQVVTQAQGLDPPGTLREQQESLVDAMALRVSGLAGLAQAFSQITAASNATQAGKSLSEQSARFVASDVVYDDFFRIPSQVILRREGITGVDVPDLGVPDHARARDRGLVGARRQAPDADSGQRPARQPDRRRPGPAGRQAASRRRRRTRSRPRSAWRSRSRCETAATARRPRSR